MTIVSQEISESFCKKISKKYNKSKLARPVYVIQEHHAKQLHWDLRLELNDVLSSWALPKEPPKQVGEKRLAVAVPDHPIEYAMFEGSIPTGNYGAGEVKIWDKGTFEIESQSEKKIVIKIKGKKLEGRYCLLHFRPAEKNWLFFKIKS